jgi:XTP/dITP diphosphohydrolase
MRVYCATGNAGKLREFRLALQGFVDVETVPGLDSLVAPEETGVTFEENAVLKALYYAKFCDGLVFTDDSGLEVDALGGDPGVYSARFAGPEASDQDNNHLLLENLQGVRERSARFVCVVALANGAQILQTFRGEVEGEILLAARGENGFGYDPLFYYPPFGCSFGEAPVKSKMEVSHRGKALAKMLAYLKGESWV